MGKIFRVGKYQFFVFSGDQFEDRLHIHVRMASETKGAVAKFWLEPEVSYFDTGRKSGFSDRELKSIENIVRENRLHLISELNKLYGR